MLHRTRKRGAALVLECAVVFPVFLLLLIGLIVGGLGVFRYQEIASLAREGARYASVHGAKYQQSTGKVAATPEEVFNKAILPRAVALDRGKLSYSVTWAPDKSQGAMVTVRLTYRWVPEAFLGGITLSSTSSVPVSY